MAVLVPILHHGQNIQSHLTKSLDKVLDEAQQSGELKMSNQKLKEFPKTKETYDLSDTVIADLSKNRFTELPEEVTTFHFLERLHCYHNAIRHIPDTVSNLQCLNYLDLSRNQLTALPRELCLLPIEILLVANNRLSCLPDELYKMSHLMELDASCNQITHFPPRMGELRSLQSLVLRSNLLLAVPVEITILKLMRLDLAANRISTLPIEMREMDSIIHFLIEDNPLTSPPASLCIRGRVHVFKYLEIEAMKIAKKTGANTGTLGRRSRKVGAGSPGPSHLATRLKNKRQNVDSGYSTSSDCYEKRWSQELGGDEKSSWPSTPILGRTAEHTGGKSASSTPSTISPTPLEEDFSKNGDYVDKLDKLHLNDANARLSPCGDVILNGNSGDDTPKIQTYREYKEALKQQRLHDVPSIYRTKDPDDQSHTKTEPNTPTHHPAPILQNHLATSKSDPTPLNSALSNPRSIFDDTGGGGGILKNSKKPVQKVQPSRNLSFSSPQHTTITTGYSNGTKLGTSGTYVKPNSPLKGAGGSCMGHDSVPSSMGASVQAVILNGQPKNNSSTLPKLSTPNYVNGNTTPKSSNGINSSKNPGWSKESAEKLSFTMRREIDKAREETDLINQLRTIIETRLKMALPEDFGSALTDGVVLCHLANHIKPRSVASIHVPSPAVPKLTMARCRRNVDNFIDACRKIGVDETLICCAADVLEGKGLVQVAVTVMELLRFHSPRSPLHSHNLSTVV